MKKRGRPVGSHGKEARKKFLTCAKKAFIENGYINTSASKIAAGTGYTVGNMYSHWKNKEEVFNEITSCVSGLTIQEACNHPEEFAMLVEKMLSEDKKLVKKLSELQPEILVSLI